LWSTLRAHHWPGQLSYHSQQRVYRNLPGTKPNIDVELQDGENLPKNFHMRGKRAYKLLRDQLA
jgi:hypothetical protein